MQKVSSSRFDVSLLDRIVSVRGPLLTFREESFLWVVRAGRDPRAWKLRVNSRGNSLGRWEHARPEADAWLHPEEHFVAERQRLRQALGECIALHRQPGHHATVEEMRQRREHLRRILKLDRLMLWTGYFPAGALEFLERHGFRFRRWHLLNLWLRVPAGRELFDDVPALGWLAASSWCYRARPVKRPLRSLRSLVKKPRCYLLRWLGLPEGHGIVRLLRTVRPCDLTAMHAEAIHRVLRNKPRRQWWSSLPQPAAARAIHLLAYEMPLSFPLLCAVSEGRSVGDAEHEMSLDQVLNDSLRMLRLLGDPNRRDALSRIESPERLVEEHDRLAREIARHQAEPEPGGERTARMPLTKGIPPPLAPAPWMRPITNLAELRSEGAEMEHCVASYESEIAMRSFYAYAVHHPMGRATLGIRRGDHGRWGLAEIRGPRNACVPRAVYADVLAWLPLACPVHEDEENQSDEFLDETPVATASNEAQLWLDLDFDDGGKGESVEEPIWLPFPPAGAEECADDETIPF